MSKSKSAGDHLKLAVTVAAEADTSNTDLASLATMHAAIAAAKYLRAIETWTTRR